MDKMDASMKAFFLVMGLILWAGIWLTGFEKIHWFLYLPASFFLISAITGICPGMVLFKDIFREKQPQSTD
jgi:ABC-type polysaccharide/polyol phosphate export permease